jgi:hypothetical protein
VSSRDIEPVEEAAVPETEVPVEWMPD